MTKLVHQVLHRGEYVQFSARQHRQLSSRFLPTTSHIIRGRHNSIHVPKVWRAMPSNRAHVATMGHGFCDRACPG
jgi:hypothetical protein